MGRHLTPLSVGVVALAAVLLAAPSALAHWEVRDGMPAWRPDPTEEVGVFADNPFDAAQAGVDWLTNAVCNWMNTTGRTQDCADGNQTKTCFGCHVQAEAVMGLARSGDRCYTLPPTTCADGSDESPVEFAAEYIAGAQRKDCIFGTFSIDCALQGIFPVDGSTRDGQPPNLGSIGHYPPCGSNMPPASIHPIIQTAHGALNLAGYTRHQGQTYASNLLAMCDWWVSRQAASGQWVPDRNEAPVDQGASFVTGAAVYAMAVAMPLASPAQQASYQAAIDRAAAWFETATHTTNQDKVFALLGLLEAGRPLDDPVVAGLRADLIDDQLADGGWAERPGLQSNAYATGQALWMLLETELDLNDPTVCAGVQWLVDTQAADGSWPLGQPGVETDSSRNSQFTATMWPVMALGSLEPFGARIDIPDDRIETCEPYVSFAVDVSHAGDSPCGLFAETDTYDLDLTSDSGDPVSVAPTTITLNAGESARVRVEWERAGPTPPPGSVVTMTLTATSRGSVTAGCPHVEQAQYEVVIPPDAPPSAVTTDLRVDRSSDDLLISWRRLEEATGGYEVVRLGCARREACLEVEPPSKAVLDALPAAAYADRPMEEVRLPEEAAGGQERLVFYKVRAVSPCQGTPGPTCNFDCAAPDVCRRGCL